MKCFFLNGSTNYLKTYDNNYNINDSKIIL